MNNKIIEFEPIYRNRFSLQFPKEFKLEPYSVKKISRINFKSGWEDIIITVQEIIKRISENIMGGQQGTFILEKSDQIQ